jgi:hypothetical protein
LATFSSKLIEGGFFDVKVGSPNILVVKPTKSCSKYMMRHQGKEQVEKDNSPAKVIRKWAFIEAKEI